MKIDPHSKKCLESVAVYLVHGYAIDNEFLAECLRNHPDDKPIPKRVLEYLADVIDPTFRRKSGAPRKPSFDTLEEQLRLAIELHYEVEKLSKSDHPSSVEHAKRNVARKHKKVSVSKIEKAIAYFQNTKYPWPYLP